MHVLQLVTNPDAPFFRQQLDSLDSLGVTTEVRSPGGTHSSTESRSIRDYLPLMTACRGIPTEEYDLVHANYGLTAPAALAQGELPTVLSLWGSDLYGRFGPLSRFCASQCEEVVVMSSDMASQLDQPCTVIPHGIDLDMFKPMNAALARERVDWDDDRYNVLFPYHAGRTLKNFPLATRVVTGVRQLVDRPVALQTLAGVDHDRMALYYNAADAVLLTSDREGSPNVVREALACNVSVVARDVGDVADWLAGVSGTALCASEHELIQGLATVLEGPRPDTARAVAKWTSAERTGKRLLEVYERAVADDSRPVGTEAPTPLP